MDFQSQIDLLLTRLLIAQMKGESKAKQDELIKKIELLKELEREL